MTARRIITLVALLLLPACRKETPTPKAAAPAPMMTAPASTASIELAKPEETPKTERVDVAPTSPTPTPRRLVARPQAAALDAEEEVPTPRRRAVTHPSNPDVTDFNGFPVDDGEGHAWPLQLRFDREPAEQLPVRICLRWDDPAADNQESCTETGAAATVYLEAKVPLRAASGEPFIRFGPQRCYSIRIWREGALIDEGGDCFRYAQVIATPGATP